MTQHDPPTDRSNGPSGPDDTSTAPADRGPDRTLLHEENDLPLAGMAHADTVNIELGYTKTNSPDLPEDSIDLGDDTLVTEALQVNSRSAGPVFVDMTGRRRKRLRRLAFGVGALCMIYTGMVGVSLAGGPVSPHALLPFPEVLENALPGLLPPEPSPTEPQPNRSAAPQQNPIGPYQPYPQPDTLPRFPLAPTSTVGAGLGVAPTTVRPTSPRPLESAAVTPTPSKPATDPSPVTPTPTAEPVPPSPSPSPGGLIPGLGGGAGGGAGGVPVPESGGTTSGGTDTGAGSGSGTGSGGNDAGGGQPPAAEQPPVGGTGGGGQAPTGGTDGGQAPTGGSGGGGPAPVVEQLSTGGSGGGQVVVVEQPQPEATYVAPAPVDVPAAPRAPIDDARPVGVIVDEVIEDVTRDDDQAAENDDESPEIDT